MAGKFIQLNVDAVIASKLVMVLETCRPVNEVTLEYLIDSHQDTDHNRDSTKGRNKLFSKVEGARGRLRSVVGKGERARGTTGGVFAFCRLIRRGSKAGEGSIVASQVEAAPPEWKHPTSSNCKKKVEQNNKQPKRERVKQANESDVQPGETGVEHGAMSSFVGDKDGLTPRGASRDGTEISHTLTDGVGSEDNVVDIEGADPPPHTTKKKAPPVYEIAFYLGSTRFMDVIEPHNPARVLRQMGYVRGIPKNPYKPIYAYRSKLAHTYSVKYNYDPQVWEELEDHVVSKERRGERAVFSWQAAPGYLQWFKSRNHRALDVALQFRLMLKDNVTAENAIAMAHAVIVFLSGVEEEEEDTVTATTTQSDGATTSTAATMAHRTSVEHASEVRE
ncbi:hypothetical protein Syun_003997 [Stephania yunnanensis]|uniref:Uncharacterized protein n=1 Tax=Stephania yunnanensis TaxID=152371 RepID=A0AAP0L4S3_9MAGN